MSQAQSGSVMFQAFHALSQFVCTLCIVTRPTHKPYMERGLPMGTKTDILKFIHVDDVT